MYRKQALSPAIFTKSGNLGDKWILGEVNVDIPGDAFQLAFIGIRGSNIQGDIAIDDVMLKTG